MGEKFAYSYGVVHRAYAFAFPASDARYVTFFYRDATFVLVAAGYIDERVFI